MGLSFFALTFCLGQTNTSFVARPAQYLKEKDAWFQTPDAQRIADNILTWQSPTGDWAKNSDTVSKPNTGDVKKLRGTFDNGATTGEILVLARAYNATKDVRYKAAVLKGLDHILKSQYPTGGWPQYAPPPADSYHRHITFNDNAMVRLMEIMRKVATATEFEFVDRSRRDAAQKSFDRGIACILKSQLKVNGKLTVWCAQHDEKDFSPRPARTFELVSLSGSESAGILRLLMTLDQPGPEVVGAVKAGAEWFESARLTGIRLVREGRNRLVVADTNAPPLWARFYQIETGQPIFVGRDGVPKYSITEIEAERRNGYAWYGSWGQRVATDYAEWSRKWLKPMPKKP